MQKESKNHLFWF